VIEATEPPRLLSAIPVTTLADRVDAADGVVDNADEHGKQDRSEFRSVSRNAAPLLHLATIAQ
jgi:hypothetical protein